MGNGCNSANDIRENRNEKNKNIENINKNKYENINKNELKELKINENINAYRNLIAEIKNLENIEVPSIPIEIIEMFKHDYEFMKKLLEYKRDPTLALLKIIKAVFIYEDNFNLEVEKEVNNRSKFFENIKKNFKKISLNFGGNKNKYTNKIDSQTKNEINEKFTNQITDKILDEIHESYSKIFCGHEGITGEQEDLINIDLKEKIDIQININKFRNYWRFKGILFAQDTKYNKYNKSIKGHSFKVKFNGHPTFQIFSFDLKRLENFSKIQPKQKKEIIDIIDKKLISQNLKNMDFDFDI